MNALSNESNTVSINGFSAYSINTDGQVFNSKRELKSFTNNRGYEQIALTNDEGEKKVKLIHRLVLENFIGECPEDFNADHINGRLHDDGTPNNTLSNLRWCHKSFNFNRPRKTYEATVRISTEMKEQVIEYLAKGLTAFEINKLTDVKIGNIYNIKTHNKEKITLASINSNTELYTEIEVLITKLTQLKLV